MKKAYIGFLAAACSFLATWASAQAPQIINYQGRLLNGTSLVNGTVGLTLRLYTNNTGGSVVYADSGGPSTVRPSLPR